MTKVTIKSYENGFSVVKGLGWAQDTHDYYNVYSVSGGGEVRYVVLHLLEDRNIRAPGRIESSVVLAMGRARSEAFKKADEILRGLGNKGTLVDKTNDVGLFDLKEEDN